MNLVKRRRVFAISTFAFLSLLSLVGITTSSAQPITRDEALAASPRIAIETPSVRGSIALKGGRIDDLALVRHRETANPQSPAAVLFSPVGSPQPYYAEFGWVGAAGSNVNAPGADAEWRQEGSGTLGVGNSVTIVHAMTRGLSFVERSASTIIIFSPSRMW
jgi:YidC/Oxa1 family membrane protein insertase